MSDEEQVEEAAEAAAEESPRKKHRKTKGLALLALLGAGGAFALKKKRDQELDEALWEDL